MSDRGDWHIAIFKAEIAETMAALRFGGNGVAIDIRSYDNQMAELQKLIFMKGKPLRVTIELLGDGDTHPMNLEDEPREVEEPYTGLY